MLTSAWTKSSHSFSNSNCAEVRAGDDGQVQVRDSKDPSGPVLTFSPDEWRAFLGGVLDGQFDLPGREVALPGDAWDAFEAALLSGRHAAVSGLR